MGTNTLVARGQRHGQHHGQARRASSLQQRSSLQVISAPEEHTETHDSKIDDGKRTLDGELHREPKRKKKKARWGGGINLS